MKQKHNGQDGQCQQRLNTYATKFFTRAIATLEVEAWGKDMAKLRIERAADINKGLALIDTLDAKLEAAVNAIPAVRPTVEGALTAGDEAIAQYDLAVEDYDNCIRTCQAIELELIEAAVKYANLPIVGTSWDEDKDGKWLPFDVAKPMPASVIAYNTIAGIEAAEQAKEAAIRG